MILASHLLPDVEFTCDRVVVMDKGRVVAEGPIEELKGPSGRVFEVRAKADTERLIECFKAAGMECHATDEDVMRVFVPEGLTSQDLFRVAARERIQMRHVRPSVPTLEDVFARAVGEQ
jgi:ABC-2 type transport system ATP-binding protein